MRESVFTVEWNQALTADVWEMQLKGDTGDITRPGQFVNVQLPGLYLRRPVSVCDVKPGELTLVYKVVGKGTAQMAELRSGELNLLTGLGNGYDLDRAGTAPLLLGGGVGVPPLYGLARALREKQTAVRVILGFNRQDEIFYEDRFRALGCDVTVMTVDGSYGRKGFVTDAMNDEPYTYFYACGPDPMLKAVYRSGTTEGEFSLEERMGCGFGACMGCSIRTKSGNKRICREGPVFRKEDLLWQI